MAKFDFSQRDSFGSKLGIIAAAAGSAIGLGNIWRFPYVTGQNGGAAFLIVYILFIIAIGIPVMLSEFTIGRRAQRNPFGAFKLLKPNQTWYLIGIMGIAAAFMILAFYSTIAGWTLEYLFKAFANDFAGKSSSELTSMFNDFQHGGLKPVIWQLVFMFLTGFVVYRGVKDGIEKYAKILMPLLLVLIVIICIRSVTLPGARAGLEFLFKPDFSKINGEVVLMALGQAFFSLSIGMGTLITYGSYINKKDNLSNTAYAVSAADTFIAVLAGIAIFPAVFAFGINPAEGEGLAFITLPNIFQSMAGGYIWSLLFFILLVIAALTSTISVLEVVVAYFSEELDIPRKKATIVASVLISILGVACTLSQGPWENLGIAGTTLFSNLEYAAANVMLPLGGLLIVVFVGWFLGKSNVTDELTNKGVLKGRLIHVFIIIVRFIAPIAIAIVFLNSLGILNL
ncbi:MAG: sodium-dependent transporter [Bacteroidales bacterium]|nr:sodium-dependent transporter [Bacteroidales bacterium]